MQFFYEPHGGKMFRSLKSAHKHLKEQANMDVQNQEVLELFGYPKLKPKLI